MNLYDLVYLIMSENQDSNIRIYQCKKDYWNKKKDLEVITYRNYGNTISGEDDELRFYYSFYKLNNHKVISVASTEFSFNLKGIPESLEYKADDCEKLFYETTSPNATGASPIVITSVIVPVVAFLLTVLIVLSDLIGPENVVLAM